MKKSPRILLYGFGPYRQFRDNITARLVKSLARQAGLKKIVFPVRFQRRQFVETLERFKPDIVLGLGQSSRREIQVEAQASNRRRARRTDQPKPIARAEARRLKTTLPPRIGREAGQSSSAGDYVCNFSMYVMLDHIRKENLNTLYGFIHIPHDYDRKKARRLIENILRRCRRASAR